MFDADGSGTKLLFLFKTFCVFFDYYIILWYIFFNWIAGSIDSDELREIITTLYECEGKPKEHGEMKAEEIFKLFDEDGDGEIDEQEFCNGCQKDEEFYKLISDGVSKLTLETKNHKNDDT